MDSNTKRLLLTSKSTRSNACEIKGDHGEHLTGGPRDNGEDENYIGGDGGSISAVECTGALVRFPVVGEGVCEASSGRKKWAIGEQVSW